MKKLLLLTLFLPLATYAQKNQVSGQVGYLNTASVVSDGHTRKSGLSNQVTITRYLTRTISVALFYEYCRWNDVTAIYANGTGLVSHSFGFSPSVHLGWLYLGPNVELVSSRDASPAYPSDKAFKHPNINFGLHVGALQKIWKGLNANEQISYDRPFLSKFSARVGLAYKF